MVKTLSELRPVYVVGVGWHRYQEPTGTPYVQLGLTAVRQALQDARAQWAAVDTSYVGTGRLGIASGRPMLSHLGSNEGSIVHIENASASGSAAFRHACIEVAAGLADIGLAVGVDKIDGPTQIALTKTGISDLARDAIAPFTHYALLTDAYMARYGVGIDEIARVAVKNHRNGASNSNAHRQKVRSLDDVLNARAVSGQLTTLQCCPVGEGAAAVVVASEEGIRRHGLDAARAIRVASSAAISETVYPAGVDFDAELTRRVGSCAMQQAQVHPVDLDVLELHDAFAIEELQYIEALGLCNPGDAARKLKAGAYDIGGEMAVSPSGGLIAMGHPLGPTGIGQIGEITMQLRGEAGARQHRGAKTGLAHMVGLGAVAYAHVLRRD
ncbi:thiolase family protein [Burkholderia lata]|uniref:Thiolase n=1 Tax=Burkholderia lata (strain ATCC 17760 / DSM 23089 / LMG 22485 / NCIMB 9086 / R18194 / 383) TaxID=482957 RepID=Q39P21_BURL3|nr:thiolase family protein [Burkholderia lata]ABB05795.1 Thiolase [Burkholderia lata]